MEDECDKPGGVLNRNRMQYLNTKYGHIDVIKGQLATQSYLNTPGQLLGKKNNLSTRRNVFLFLIPAREK